MISRENISQNDHRASSAMIAYCRLNNFSFHALKMLTNWFRIHRAGWRRGSEASCMVPCRFRLHSRHLNHRLPRRFHCLRFELEIAMHAGTADNDAKHEEELD